MGAFKTDENGHIIVDESMSDELKEKIRSYNGYLDADTETDEEISDEAADSYEPEYDPEEDMDDDSDDGEEEYVEFEEDDSIGEEELNDLNDLFS